ncbi:MAG: preprotein translocase subunit YajC [Chlamydiia bacterium]|nr:preprotein translocase subunit YajC [Chlamydiia bacterium]
MNLFPTILAQAEPVPPSDYSSYQGLVLILVGFVFLYFILWRPEQKRRKALEEQRTSMKKGDKVIAVGIVGTVDKIDEDTVVLKMVDGAKIEVLKAAISDVIPEEKS